MRRAGYARKKGSFSSLSRLLAAFYLFSRYLTVVKSSFVRLPEKSEKKVYLVNFG